MSGSNSDLSNSDLFTKLLEAIKEEGRNIKDEIKKEIHAENEKLLSN